MKSASALVGRMKVVEGSVKLWLGSLQSKTTCSAAVVDSFTGDFEGVVGAGTSVSNRTHSTTFVFSALGSAGVEDHQEDQDVVEHNRGDKS